MNFIRVSSFAGFLSAAVFIPTAFVFYNGFWYSMRIPHYVEIVRGFILLNLILIPLLYYGFFLVGKEKSRMLQGAALLIVFSTVAHLLYIVVTLESNPYLQLFNFAFTFLFGLTVLMSSKFLGKIAIVAGLSDIASVLPVYGNTFLSIYPAALAIALYSLILYDYSKNT